MILVIRISGMIDVPYDIEDAMHRIRLRRKYSATLIEDTAENTKLLRKIRNHVAFGEVKSDTLKKLIKTRGQPIKSGDKIDVEKVVEGLHKKSLKDLGLKPFFRLHPPRGGIVSKKHFGVGKGVLGDNKEKINVLVEKML